MRRLFLSAFGYFIACISAIPQTPTPLLPTHRWKPISEPLNQLVVFKTKPSDDVVTTLGSETLKSLNTTGLVDYIEPDYRVQMYQTPSLTGGGSTPNNTQVTFVSEKAPGWGLDRIDQSRLPLDDSFRYPSKSGAGVNIYVIDTGVDTGNAEFGGRASFGINTVPNSNVQGDDNGHGTFSAGIIAGKTYGVAKKANIIAVKSLGADGSALVSEVLRGLSWVVSQHQNSNNKKTIVNLSLGSPYSRATNQAVAQATAAGILIVSAAGNGDENGNAEDACNFSPASSSSSITVGATDINDQVAPFSNYGTCVTILAPGVGVDSIGEGGAVTAQENKFTTMGKASGTSFSAPYVAGVAALILGEAGPMKPADLINRIKKGATSGAVIGASRGTPNLLLNAQGVSYNAKATPNAVLSFGSMLALVLAMAVVNM